MFCGRYLKVPQTILIQTTGVGLVSERAPTLRDTISIQGCELRHSLDQFNPLAYRDWATAYALFYCLWVGDEGLDPSEEGINIALDIDETL